MAISHSFYKFAFPLHSISFTYKTYGQQPYILEDVFDMMIYLLFYNVNIFSGLYFIWPLPITLMRVQPRKSTFTDNERCLSSLIIQSNACSKDKTIRMILCYARLLITSHVSSAADQSS